LFFEEGFYLDEDGGEGEEKDSGDSGSVLLRCFLVPLRVFFAMKTLENER